MSEKVFHICNSSSRVIFRVDSDYSVAIIKAALAAQETGAKILAYAIMSTHFHFVISTKDPKAFMSFFKRSYTTVFNAKYGSKGVLFTDVLIRELKDFNQIRTVISHVLKNPLHHNFVQIALSYKYSSIMSYFTDLIYGDELCLQISKRYKIKVSELDYLTRRKLFGKTCPSENLRFDSHNNILPSSFLDVDFVMKIYETARSFLYHINRPMSEEYKVLNVVFPKFLLSDGGENKTQLIGKFYSSLPQIEKLSDVKVCEIIDELCGYVSFLKVSNDKLEIIMTKLYLVYGLSRMQIARCLWRKL